MRRGFPPHYIAVKLSAKVRGINFIIRNRFPDSQLSPVAGPELHRTTRNLNIAYRRHRRLVRYIALPCIRARDLSSRNPNS